MTARDRDTITRHDVLTWGKVAAIVLPLVVTIVGAAIKVSSDATELRKDVDQIKAQVHVHGQRLDSISDVGPTLARLVAEMSKLSALVEAQRVQVVALEERLNAQTRNVERFWETTWPVLEDRLKRIEAKLDRLR